MENLLWVLYVIIHKLQIPSVCALGWGDAGIESLLQLRVHSGEYFVVLGLKMRYFLAHECVLKNMPYFKRRYSSLLELFCQTTT